MKDYYDCIVVGGGIAGVGAALCAARNGIDVLLVEKQYELGGLATLGLINWYEPLCNGQGKQFIYGISEELLKLAAGYGGTLDRAWLTEGKGSGRYATFFNHHIFAAALTCLLTDEGAELSFDTLFTGVKKENGRISSLFLETVEGRKEVSCGFVIDATGTARVCGAAGIPTEDGRNWLSFYTNRAGSGNEKNRLRVWDIYGATISGSGQPEDCPMLCGAYADDINTYVRRTHRIFLDEVKNNGRGEDTTELPHIPQFRMIRRIKGEECIGSGDKNKPIPLPVGVFGYFCRPGEWFEIPYGCLYNAAVGNLYAAGRIISAEGEGWDGARVIPVAAQTGEIAAQAVSMLVAQGKNSGNDGLDVYALRRALREKGLCLCAADAVGERADMARKE